MDFKKYIDGFYATASVLSVERKEEGRSGEIRIVAGNRGFIDMVEHPAYVMEGDMSEIKFEAGEIYSRYLPKTPDFEEKCYQAAVLKKSIHSYIYLNVCDLWFSMFFWPIDQEDGDLCYCGYSTVPCAVDDIDTSSPGTVSIANDVLKTCIKLRGAIDFRQTMTEVIDDIRKQCGSEACTLLLVEQEKGEADIFAQSRAEDSTYGNLSQKTNMYDIAMSWLDTIGERDCIIVRNEKDMEYVKTVNYPWYQTLVEARIANIIIFPLRSNRKLLGFIWAYNFDLENASRIKETLELTTFFISSELAGHLMLKQLQHISYTDLLTGINNRNAMNNRVLAITSGQERLSDPYGIVFADINGLKKMNDENGHAAGDLLIKKAALVLQEVFIGDDIYRAGGDEFMVIVQGCSEEILKSKVKELKQKASDPDNVCMSVGSAFSKPEEDIRDAMRCADEDMYKDKEEYYILHPERRYR